MYDLIIVGAGPAGIFTALEPVSYTHLYFSLRVQKGESPLVLLRDVVTLLPGA